jgi:hypothetical protein
MFVYIKIIFPFLSILVGENISLFRDSQLNNSSLNFNGQCLYIT